MIIGIGCDLVNVLRIKKLIIRLQYRFLKKIYTPLEIRLAPVQQELLFFYYYAKRFAAKEAYAKATGYGIGQYVAFHSLQILNNDQGKPYFYQHPFIAKNINTYLALSDDYPYVVSYVFLTQD